MKKVISIVLLVSIISLYVCGCGIVNQDYPQYNNLEDYTQSNYIDNYTLSNYLEKSKESPIIFYDVSSIDKDEVPDYVYVFYNNMCICYDNDGIEYKVYGEGFNLSLTLGELSQLDDKTIIEKYETAWENGYNEALLIWESNSEWANRLKSGEATVFKNDYMTYDICIMTDSSGNSTESEWLFLPKAGYGKRTYTMWYDHWGYSTHVSQGDFSKTYFNTGYGTVEQDLEIVCSVYKITNANIQGTIYNSNYIGFNTDQQHKLITRDDVKISLDNINNFSYGVDYDTSDLGTEKSSFLSQYLNLFEFAYE